MQTGYRFGKVYVDVRNRELWRDGRLLALNSKYFEVLLLLLRDHGQLVEKQKIFDEVWQGVIVTDAALTQCIKDIRKALGDEAGNPRFIKTVPKHGYVFIGNLVPADGEPPLAPSLPASEAAGPLHAEAKPARPYKFLDYFTEQDAGLFFGRESEIEAICSKILAHRCFILHGRSGVGKSSILRAGIAPRLKAHGHLVFSVRSFTDPLEQMRSAMTTGGKVERGLERIAVVEKLAEALRGLPSGQAATFLFDQFEEFFSLLADDTKQHFIAGMARLYTQENLPLRFVFAIREDVLADMSLLKSAIPEIFYHEYRLLRLNREQATRAMIEPARAAGCAFDPKLATHILDDLGDSGGIDPPQLQIVCDHLYDARDSNDRIGLESYGRLGTASKILANYLERVMQRFSIEDLEIARELLTALITVDGQRLVLRPSDLLRTIAAPRRTEVLGELVVARIVRRRQQDGETWLELSHDFLIPEISRWLTADVRDLKRARAVVERAIENFRSHQLLIDAEALDLLLPFGENLALTAEQADLLLLSALHRVREIPQWLLHASSSAAELLNEACRHANPEVRRGAINACRGLHNAALQKTLCRLSLWDESMQVRKDAGIALAESSAALTPETFAASESEKQSGTIRRAVSLALVRDHDKKLAPLSRHYLVVSLLVVLGLMWVRLRRGFPDIVRIGGGGTLGGATSGLVGGLALGLSLIVARHTTPFHAVSLMLVLVNLGIIVGALGAAGVSFGMIAARHVTYRHNRFWSALGAAAGGALIGGVTNLLGVDTLWALFGQTLSGEIAGAFEGTVIGAGMALGAIIGGHAKRREGFWLQILGGGLGAMVAGVLLTLIGGNLFSGSLEIVARAYSDSQLRMDALATLFGESHAGTATLLIMGAIEGGLFGGMTMAGMMLASHRSMALTSDSLGAP